MSDRPPLPDLLAALAEAVATLPAGDLPRYLGELERLRADGWARLTALAHVPEPAGAAGRMLTIDEAAVRTGMSKDWLYHHAKDLPFVRRIGRSLRFSEAGLTRWLATRRR